MFPDKHRLSSGYVAQSVYLITLLVSLFLYPFQFLSIRWNELYLFPEMNRWFVDNFVRNPRNLSSISWHIQKASLSKGRVLRYFIVFNMPHLSIPCLGALLESFFICNYQIFKQTFSVCWQPLYGIQDIWSDNCCVAASYIAGASR